MNRFKQASRRPGRALLVNTARLVWITILVWGEIGAFYFSISDCQWPKRDRNTTRILLLSDPQVRHPLAFVQETSWMGFLRQVVFDLNLKKAWHVTARLKPEVVIFLGDMTAHGRHTRNADEFREYFAKFMSIFRSTQGTKFYFLPGNSDVAMGIAASGPRSFYPELFGPFNQILTIRNHTLVCLDSPGLVDEDYKRTAQGLSFRHWPPVPGGAVEFVHSVPKDRVPLILLTHIPLARPDAASCGPRREKGKIGRMVGHGYQTTLGKQTTNFLLETLHPAVIFSGDNRDYCEYTHSLSLDVPGLESTPYNVKEVTVKSFSLSNHIRRPGFQLLSISDPPAVPSPLFQSWADVPCLLPDQYGIYQTLYLDCAVLTVILLFFINWRRLHRLRGRHPPPHISLHRSSPPSRSPMASALTTESGIWSPYTPPLPVSPLGNISSTIRTPYPDSGPTLRSASRPATPLGSPLLSPIVYTHEEEEGEEEAGYAVQYAIRRSHVNGGHWDIEGSSTEDFSMQDSAANPKLHTSSWSWTFVFRGQRRRMTIHPPTFSYTAFRDLIGFLEPPDVESVLRHRGLFKSTVLDALSIAWVVLTFWAILNWWFF